MPEIRGLLVLQIPHKISSLTAINVVPLGFVWSCVLALEMNLCQTLCELMACAYYYHVAFRHLFTVEYKDGEAKAQKINK